MQARLRIIGKAGMIDNYIADPKYQRALFYRASFLKVLQIYSKIYRRTGNKKYLVEMKKWGQRTEEMAKNIEKLKR